MSKFEELLNRVSLTEEYLVSFFVNSMKVVIRYTVRVVNPINLQQAISLAKLLKIAIENAHRKGKFIQMNVNALPHLLTPKLL